MVDITEIDLTTGNGDSSFGIINEESDQRTIIVVRNSSQNFSFFNSNTTLNKTFTLSLIDSSTGIMVGIISIIVCYIAIAVLHLFNRLAKQMSQLI